MKTTRKKKVTAPPQYVALQYKFSHKVLDATHFQLTSEPFELMPNELIIEKIREKGTINAATYARSPQRNNRHLVKTGIRKVSEHEGYGDQLADGEKNLLIFRTSRDKHFMTVWHFKGYYPYTVAAFTKKFLKTQLKGLNL
jgi:hypothetical protein